MAKGTNSRKELRGGSMSGKDKKELPKAKLNAENFKKSFKLFHYLKHAKWKFALGMICLAASAGVGLYFPMISGKMFGIFGETGNNSALLMQKLQETGGILLIFLAGQGVFSFGRVFLFSQVTESILKGLRNDTFGKLVQMPMSFFSKNQTAELSSRIATDINVISEAFTINIAEVIRQSIVGIGGLVLI